MTDTNTKFDRISRRDAIVGTVGLGVGGVIGRLSAEVGEPPSRDRPASAAIAADVKREFRWAWEKYKTHAWGHDHLEPITGSHRERFFDGGLTIVEALDTLSVMGLDEEVDEAVEWIENDLDFDVDHYQSVFEGTIRYVGGLLAGYKVTGNETLLDLAEEFADRLYPAFDRSPSGMPYADVNLATGEVRGKNNYVAEIGTHIAEWGELSRLTGDQKYYDAAKNVLRTVYENRSDLDLVGAAIDVETETWTDRVSRIGPPVDSFYEYLWDGWRLFEDEDLRTWYETILAGVETHMAEQRDGHLWYKRVDMHTGELKNRQQSELAQFFAGLLAESGHAERGAAYHDAWTQVHEAFGLPPGSIDYSNLSAVGVTYWLRPEYLGSTLLLYDQTGDDVYRDRGYRHYEQMKEHCRAEHGFTVLTDVTVNPMKQGNVTPGYWWSENMKYFYLLFDDGSRVADDYYLTTEGNLLRGI